MPNKRITMRKIREILRLRFEVGLSFRQISQCADVSTGAIQKMLKRLESSELSWPLPEGMTEPRLASLLYPESDSRPGALEDPDWAEIHMELRKKGVTRHLLWEEYCQRMPVRAYSYSQFCCRYQAWCQLQKRSMRQQHPAGEKLFIDYCGPTVPVISAETGECRQAQIFVAELNHCIRTLVTDLNERPFKKLPGNRREAFERLDKPALRPLPVQPWRYRHIKKAKVNIDYHVEYEQHHYSVPHQYVGKTVELHTFDNLLEVWSDGQMIAVHPRRLHPGNSTTAEHMPERHRHHQQWTPGRLKNWAAGVGPDTLTWISARLAEKAHPEQAYRLCLGLLSLTREYPSERVNNSCRLANTEGLIRLKQVKSILKNNRDLVPVDGDLHPSQELPQEHENIRGPRHFH
ncbi:Mu transposase domain-containing protein [Morganella morganii]|uniref:Mu transposase domain-containing protein n=1 Tax=Morganella morganii TaxID=582 RepID=UPI001BDB7590|nr:IS21 family transposase [Morganella morganii]MBT0462907.1 IS21 family transposase [Morganella morganii subsp. morganii]